MTITTLATRVEYAGDGYSTAFAIPFPFFGSAEINALLLFADGITVQQLLLNGDYTVAGGNDAEGTLTMMVPPIGGENLVIYRLTNRTQTTSLQANDDMPAAALETAFDRLLALEQEDLALLSQTLRAPIQEAPLAPLPPAIQRAGRVLCFDLNGQPTTAGGSPPTLAVTVYQAPSFSLEQYGGHGDDSTLNDTAWSAMLTAAAAQGVRQFRLQEGVYRFASTIAIPDFSVLSGVTSGTSVLRFMSPIGDCVGVGVDSLIERVKIIASGARTEGFTVKLLGNGSSMLDIEIGQAFIAVSMCGADLLHPVVAQRCTRLVLRDPSVGRGSGGILVDQFASQQISEVVATGTASGQQPDWGIRARNGDTLIISDCNITRYGIGLYTDVSTGNHLYGLHAVNSFFDSGQVDSASLVPNGGVVSQARFSNCWFGLAIGGNGCSVGPGVDGCSFTGCTFSENAAAGLASGARNVVVTGGYSSGNVGAGLDFAASSVNFTVTGHQAGPIGGTTSNGYGIVTEAGADYYVLQGNHLMNNTVSSLLDNGGPHKIVGNNLT